MNPILIDFGIIQIYWYSVIMLIAIITGSILFFTRAKKEGYNDDFLTNTLFYMIIFGIIGARLYYVIFKLSYYLKQPFEILAIWNGGLAIHGGIIGGSLCLFYHTLKYKKSFFKLADLFIPSLILGQAIGRWGNFFNGEAHGQETAKAVLEKLPIPTFVINGMNIEGIYYEPTFFYESIGCLLGFIVIMIISNRKIKTGMLTGIYFIWYSLIRFFIESRRTDSLMIGNAKIAQLISVILLLLGIYLVLRKKKDTRLNRLKERMEKYARKL